MTFEEEFDLGGMATEACASFSRFPFSCRLPRASYEKAFHSAAMPRISPPLVNFLPLAFSEANDANAVRALGSTPLFTAVFRAVRLHPGGPLDDAFEEEADLDGMATVNDH